MTYKADRPFLKHTDNIPWFMKLWDWFKSTFWLLFLVAIFGGLTFLAYQAVMNDIHADRQGSTVGTPK